VQEVDGTPVALDDYDSQTPYPATKDDSSWIDLESRLQFLRLRRRRSLLLAVLQYVNDTDIDGCSMHLSARTDWSDRIARRFERTEELSCQ
jgi:hypothetical protein